LSAARAAAVRDRPPGRTRGRRAGEVPRSGGAPRRRLDPYKSNSAEIRFVLRGLSGVDPVVGKEDEDSGPAA